ncbi:MAG: glycosyltransferase [Phycisphaerales bacterium]|nr:glycosyltransferase [Phycisphaerales bacterium]
MTASSLSIPEWSRTDRALSIAVLGWARLSRQAGEGSGYNLSASELAAGLARSGHRVSYLASGRRYSLIPGMRVSPTEEWRGVACFDLVNSANLSPAIENFRNVKRELSSARQSRVVLRWLGSVGAEVVHIHSLEGFGLDLIGAIRASGRPVVVTPHNYWYVCPQVDLLHNEMRVCTDYEGGRKCVDCVPGAPHPSAERWGRRLEQAVAAAAGRPTVKAVRHVGRAVRRRLGMPLVGPDAADYSPPFPDPEAPLGFDIDPDERHPGTIDHGLRLLDHEKPVEIGASPIDENERFLRADHHLTVLNEYGRRRTAGIEALNRASAVTPPSEFLLRVLVRMGLRAEIGRQVRLGQPHFDQLNRVARRSPFYGVRPWDAVRPARPVRFAFLGTTRNNKGLEVLTRAIPLVSREARQRCHFVIRASGYDWPFRKRLSAYPEVSFHGGFDLLQLLSAVGEFDVGLLPHIWFENSPLVMLEYLHAGKFVIASRLGGPVEWVQEPRGARPGNGLLFPAGDAAALAERIERVALGRVVLPSAREVHEASTLRSYPDHVAEVEGLYRELLEPSTPPRAPGAPAAPGVVVAARAPAAVKV